MTRPERNFSNAPKWAKTVAITIMVATPLSLGGFITLLILFITK